ncbi:ComF family protein [Lacticaseibacillus kribbianus]|uniref:ComF family protein n=1 Tax=Lacticaseibacillus kribbianus TaxID=2926292 RepID=UPI001CD6B140|nr:ComF family protein [Lacticaseibacillus kribbianus]
MTCRWCHRPLTTDFTLAELIGLRPLRLANLCPRCQARFARIDPKTACPGCGRAHSPRLCQDCRRWQARYPSLHHRALFTYSEEMRLFIQQYKGLGHYQLHDAFVAELDLKRRGVALVPLVSEPGHLARRGFDPVVGLFGHLPLSRWLEKTDTAQPQAEKTRRERLATPQSFVATLPARPAARVLLLDDLYTTGRTFYHAQQALRAAGYTGEIHSFSLIR